MFDSIITIFICGLAVARRTSKSAYFSQEIQIPPLPKSNPSTPYGDSMNALYTNDPSAAAEWCKHHIPDNGFTAIGFDVEVSKPIDDPTLINIHPTFEPTEICKTRKYAAASIIFNFILTLKSSCQFGTGKKAISTDTDFLFLPKLLHDSQIRMHLGSR